MNKTEQKEEPQMYTGSQVWQAIAVVLFWVWVIHSIWEKM